MVYALSVKIGSRFVARGLVTLRDKNWLDDYRHLSTEYREMGYESIALYVPPPRSTIMTPVRPEQLITPNSGPVPILKTKG